MSPLLAKSLRWSLLAMALAIAVILLGILPINAGFVRGMLEDAVHDAVAMELSIDGPVKLRLGPWPNVTTGDLVLGDAANDPLVLIDSLQAKISLAALLGGQVRVLELEAHGIDVDYCSPFPEFPDAVSDETEPPSIAVDDVAITAVSIRCGPSPGTDPLELALEQVSASARDGTAIQLTAAGSFAGMKFDLTATGGELNDLLAATEPFPVTAAVLSDAAAVEASGNLLVSPSPPSVDAQVQIRDTDVQALAKAFDIELPDLGLLNASGRLRGNLETLELERFKGDLGSSRFEFDTTLDMTGDRLHARLAATLNPLDLAPFLDSESPTQPSSSANVIDDIDFSAALDSLDAIDADLQVNVSELAGLSIDVKSVELTGQLTDGVVTLQSLTADMIGGQVSADGALDTQAECPELRLRVRGADLDFAALGPLLSLDQPLGGDVDSVSLESTSCGESLFAHRDSLRAGVELVGARVSLGEEHLPLSMTRMHVSTAPGERSQLKFFGKFMGEKLEATIAAGSLGEILGPESWPIDLDARGGGGRLRLDGRAGAVPGTMTLDARLAFAAPRLGTLHPWTGVAADAGLPLNASTRLRLDESRFVADDIAISLGESTMRGRMAWNYAQDPDLLDLRIRSESINLAKIATAFPPAAEQTASTDPETTADGGNASAPFALPPVDLDLAFDAVHADRLDIQDFRVSGRLRKGLIDNARISVLLEDEIALRGELDVDLRQLPARAKAGFSAENLDIGRVLARVGLADDLRLRADALELLVTTDGMSPREMLLNSLLRVELRGFNWTIPRTDPDTGTVIEDALDFTLGQVQLTMTPDQPTTWSSKGSLDDVDVKLWMQTPSLRDSFNDDAELPVTLIAAAGNNVVMIDTRIDRSADERLAAHVSLSGQVIDSRSRDLSELASPLEDYELQSDIVLNERLLELPNTTLRLGSSLATGYFEMDTNGPRTRIDVELNAQRLQTDDLLYWSGDFLDAMVDEVARSHDESDPKEDVAEAPDASGEKRGVLYRVKDFLGEFREDNDLDLRITVDDLRAGPDRLGKAELRLYVDADDFLLQPVTIRLPGGGVNAEYTASTRNGRLDAGLSIKADALSYGGLLRLADPESEARGLLFVDVDIDTDTVAPPDAVPFQLLFENAGGSASVVAWPENIEAGVLDLWSANLIFALLPQSETGHRSRLNCVVTRFDINDGLMKSKATLLDTTDTVIRGRGTIDLAQEKLDLVVWPQAKREKFLSVSTPIAISGTFDDFRIGVEPAGFVGTMIKWYTSLIYVPFKWLTGKRFPADGTATCFDAMDWELTPELQDYFLQRDFSAPPSLP